MLPDRDRDILRVQAKNVVKELRKEFKLTKAEGREDATTRETRVPGTERRASGEESTSLEGPSETQGGPG